MSKVDELKSNDVIVDLNGMVFYLATSLCASVERKGSGCFVKNKAFDVVCYPRGSEECLGEDIDALETLFDDVPCCIESSEGSHEFGMVEGASIEELWNEIRDRLIRCGASHDVVAETRLMSSVWWGK